MHSKRPKRCSGCHKVWVNSHKCDDLSVFQYPAITQETSIKPEQVKSMELENMKQLEIESLDLEPFEGQKVKIDQVEQVEVSSQFNSRGKQWCLRVLSDPVMKGQKGNDIRASELLNLVEDDAGQVKGWHPKGNVAKFLAKYKAKTPLELIGKTAVIKIEKKGEMQYLRFVY